MHFSSDGMTTVSDIVDNAGVWFIAYDAFVFDGKTLWVDGTALVYTRPSGDARVLIDRQRGVYHALVSPRSVSPGKPTDNHIPVTIG